MPALADDKASIADAGLLDFSPSIAAAVDPDVAALSEYARQTDPDVEALSQYAREAFSGGVKPNFTPALPRFGMAGSPHGDNPHGANPHGANPHGGSPHGGKPHGAMADGASPHGGSPHGASSHDASGAGPRFTTLQVNAAPSLKLPDLPDVKAVTELPRFRNAMKVATGPEQHILRFHEQRIARASLLPLARQPDYATLMPAIADDQMVTTWVSLDQAVDSPNEPPRFDFINILGSKTDDWKPVMVAAKKEPKAAASARAPMVAPAPGDPDGRYFVGSKPCETCHAGLFDEFQQTVMGRNLKISKGTPQGKMECETCHGPGSAHVNGGGGREKGGIRSFRLTDSRLVDERMTIEDFNGVCLSCHERGDRTYWQGSAHESRGLACVNCHTVMRKVSPRNQLKTPLVMDTCFQCHKDRKAQAQRSSHMPIRENKITCVNCHNPHGTPNDKLLREASVNDTCYQCHADKRGPFLFEHPPVRENCLNCHEPHGSNHESLLIVARPRLCQQCHTPPHASAGLNPALLERQVGTSCQNCHTNIHGSNSPSGVRWHR